MKMNQWDRQRHPDTGELEPNLWFDRFTRLYLVAGPERTLLGAYNAWREEEGKSGKRTRVPQSWDINSKKWKWKERAEAWDAENRRVLIQEEQEAQRDMLRRHARQAQALQGVGAQALQDLARRVKDGTAKLTASEIRQLFETGTKLERQALGLPEHFMRVLELSDDDLIKQYGGLYQQIASSGGDASGDYAAWLASAAASADEDS